MRKVTILTLMTVALLAASGCNRGWPRFLCRGDDCNTSSCEGSTSLMPPSYGPSYGPGYMPSYTQPNLELPGPQTIGPNG
jgi:hypothetical protein